MLVEEAVEKLNRAKLTDNPEIREQLIDEVIEALEEGKIEPAEKRKILRLVAVEE